MIQPPFSICVYCGSRHGALPDYREAAVTLGSAIGERGWRLVYGGGRVGLMGEVADAVLRAGGTVIGVIPEALMRREVGHAGLSELHVVPDMHTRKRMMAEQANAFVAMPGGIGTFEELFEVWTWRQLGYHDKPLGLLNVAGYYEGLLRFMDHAVAQAFLSEQQRDLLHVAAEPRELLTLLWSRADGSGGDYRSI